MGGETGRRRGRRGADPGEGRGATATARAASPGGPSRARGLRPAGAGGGGLGGAGGDDDDDGVAAGGLGFEPGGTARAPQRHGTGAAARGNVTPKRKGGVEASVARLSLRYSASTLCRRRAPLPSSVTATRAGKVP